MRTLVSILALSTLLVVAAPALAVRPGNECQNLASADAYQSGGGAVVFDVGSHTVGPFDGFKADTTVAATGTGTTIECGSYNNNHYFVAAVNVAPGVGGGIYHNDDTGDFPAGFTCYGVVPVTTWDCGPFP